MSAGTNVVLDRRAAKRQVRKKKKHNNVLSFITLHYRERKLTAFFKAGEALVLGHAAASAGGLAGGARQSIEAAERAELCPLFLLSHVRGFKKLGTCGLSASKRF